MLDLMSQVYKLKYVKILILGLWYYNKVEDFRFFVFYNICLYCFILIIICFIYSS